MQKLRSNEEVRQNEVSERKKQLKRKRDRRFKVQDSDKACIAGPPTSNTCPSDPITSDKFNIVLPLDSKPLSKKAKLSKVSPFEKLKNSYFQSIQDGPIHRCECCDRLWFMKSLTKILLDKIKSKMPKDKLSSVFSQDIVDNGLFCGTCRLYIMKGDIPPLASSYGFKYPPQPQCLAVLNDLEERLVSLRIPFMQIRELGKTRQYGCKGSVVNVPITFQQTVAHLPKNPNDNYLLHLKLKRRLSYKSHYLAQYINPKRVFEASRYLQQKELYKSEGVELDLSWLEKFETESFPEGNTVTVDLSSDDPNSNDYWDSDLEDDEEEEHSTLAETMIEASHTYNDPAGLALAPGETQHPITFVFDELADEKTYPKIYCGDVRLFTRKKPPTYLEMCKSELQRYDRRGATPQKVLYNFHKVTHLQLLSCASIALRNKIVSENNITVKDALDSDYLRTLQYKGQAYKFMKTIKSCPAHWAMERSRALAQIRQFGSPHIFLTLSAAELQWYDLIKHLVFLHQNRQLTEEEFNAMNSATKIQLIRNDPVTCASYFNHKIGELFKVLKSVHGPFGKYEIQHYFRRIEFQQRGSPHSHGLYYLKDAPVYDGNNDSEIVQFVDMIMTCSLNHPLVHLQRHRHTQTCHRKKGKNEYCRFNIPTFPMDKTRILIPFENKDSRKNIKAFTQIRERLLELEDYDHSKINISFQDFLQNLGLELNEYLDAIRSGIERPKMYLKRNVNEILINAYNSDILSLMQSNMDIQFTLDQYRVVAYLVDYVSKSNAGLSKQMRECVEATKRGNMSLKENLKAVSNAFLNAREVSAQEAAWSLLEFPMSQMSEDDIFIPTFPPNKRSHLIKSDAVLNEMDKSSTDIFEKGIVDKYVDRPNILNSLCLADFAAWYDFKKVGENNLKLQHGKHFCHKRTKSKVLRFCNYKKSKNEEEYFHEQVMLYMPWRNEYKDILSHSCEELYESNKETIQEHRKAYVFNDEIDWDEELMVLAQEAASERVADEEILESKLYERTLLYDPNEILTVDIGLDMNAGSGK